MRAIPKRLWCVAIAGLALAASGTGACGVEPEEPLPQSISAHRVKHGEEFVWSGLVYASTKPNPSPAPRQLAGFARKLKNVFGYNQLELLSEHRELMDETRESWLLPGGDFCFRIESRKAGGEGYLLGLQLYHDKRLLVQTEAKLGFGSPIFFRGPLYADGQLIIVLIVE